MKKLPFYIFNFSYMFFLFSCSEATVNKTSEQMCVEAQMNMYDQAKKGSKQREYFDTAFKNREAYNAWAWRECMKK